jgi:alkylation response protein AidB-like acyl-CoA dehydrogenase
MDFTFSPEADDAAALAAEILADSVDQGRDDAWERLAEAGLLTLCLPEDHDGAGLGLLEQGRVLVEVGRVVAPGAMTTHVAAGRFLSEAGVTPRPGRLTVALSEPHDHLPAAPAVTYEDGRLTGVKTLVRGGMDADTVLVTASTPTGPGVFLVEGRDLHRTAQRLSDGDEVAVLELDGTPATLVDGDAERLAQLVVALTCAEQLGVTEGALALTAAYAKSREQFGRPIGTFQAVAHRLADAHIDLLGQRLTLWQALWRLDENLPAAREVAVAKLWAADAGHRIAHTTVHVHGGVGIDLDGTAHRYFTAAKRHELTLGGATQQAIAIGRLLAAEPA